MFNKYIVSIALLSAMLMPSFAFAQEPQKVANSVKTERTAPLKAFFARFVKKKEDKKPKKQTIVEDKPAVIKAGIVYTIDDCVKIALSNSPLVKNKQKTLEYQKSAVGIAKSNYFPTLTGGTGYKYTNSKNFGDIDNSLNNSYYGIDVGVTQLIWDFGRTTAKINMSKYNFEAASYDLDYSKLNCVFDTKLSYTYVLAARAATDVWAQNVRINELNVERAKAMYDVGLKAKIDVVNAQSNLTEAKINLLSAQNDYQNSLIDLNFKMYYRNAPVYSIVPTETFHINKNYNIKNEISIAYDKKNYTNEEVKAGIKDGSIFTTGIEKRDVAEHYVLKPFPLTMQETIDTAFKNRADLKSMKLVQKAAAESLKAVKKSYYPALNASGGYGLRKFSDYGSNNVSVYAGLDLPTVNAMAIKNQIEQGKANLAIALNNVSLLEDNIYFEIQSLYVNMKQIEEKIPLMKQKVEYSLENFELADGRYSVGMGNYLELQQALTDYNNAQLNFVNTVFLYNKARFNLEKAMNVQNTY